MPALEKLPPGLKMPSWQLSGYLCRSCTIYAVSPYFLLYVLFAISIRSWIRLSFAVRFDIKMLCHILSQMISMANKPHHLVVWNTTISSCIWFDTILCTYVPRGRKPNMLENFLCVYLVCGKLSIFLLEDVHVRSQIVWRLFHVLNAN